MKDVKIVFMGTATFSATVLEKLIANGYCITAVVSQPDRLVGRKKEIKMPEVKQLALLHSIPVIQPQNIKKEYQEVIDLQPDVIITAAYGQIIPEIVLQSARIGAINVHASLLPQYRGGAPVHQAIIDGNKETGVTIMYMVKAMDAGNIIAQKKLPILDSDTTGTLYDKLALLGGDTLIETLPSILEGTNASLPQDESLVTYAPIITREKEKISFDKPVQDIHNLVRGLYPWPVGYTMYAGKTVKIWAGHVHDCKNAMEHHRHQEPGTIVKIFKDAIGVKGLDGIYLITELQVEGKKRMRVKEYLNGNSIFVVDTKFE